MGMAVSSDGDDNPPHHDGNPPAAEAPSSSLHSLAAEATASADGYDDTELSREERARKALECDCVAELREGPCGSQFSEAFYCFLTSTAEEQGSDCIKPFIAMQTCMAANPEAFVQYSGDDRNDSNAEGECKPQGNKQDGPPVPSPPAGAIKNPIS
ncbi:hypothetical protein M758_9G007000 [Ceratodon purpureus]|nr:hypothetical protein M758_9G007000 [Ceratodon purpureus]